MDRPTTEQLEEAIRKTARPVTMVALNCGDYATLEGTHQVHDVVPCTETGCVAGTAEVIGAFQTKLVG